MPSTVLALLFEEQEKQVYLMEASEVICARRAVGICALLSLIGKCD